MIYTITYYAGMSPAGADTCHGTIERARAHAVAAVNDGIAQRAEVRDLERRVLYTFPSMPCM